MNNLETKLNKTTENPENNFSEIRQALESNRAASKENTNHEFAWGMYDSPLKDFGKTFCKTIPDEYAEVLKNKNFVDLDEYGKAWKNYIEDTLEAGAGNLKAIEFGGPGSELFADFTKKFFKKTVGVCLEDIRDPDSIKKDESLGHSVVQGDILDTKDSQLEKNIEEKLDGKKVNLIISRMMGPLKELDKHEAIMSKIIKKWYSMLDTEGLMFIQFEYKKEHNPEPYFYLQQEYPAEPKEDSEKLAEQWAQEITKEYKNKIEIQLAPGAIRLYKKLGAPETL